MSLTQWLKDFSKNKPKEWEEGGKNMGKFLPRIRDHFEIEPNFASELHLSGPQFLYKQEAL